MDEGRAQGRPCDEETLSPRLELEAVFEAVVDPVVILDVSGCVVAANPAASAALGFDPVGHDRFDLARHLDYRLPDGTKLRPQDLPGFRAESGELVRDVLLTARGPEGERRSWVVSAAVFPREGSPLGTVVTFHDVTDRERLLAELRDSVRLGEALNRINAAIAASCDFSLIMEAVVHESAEALGADRAAVAMPEHGGWVGQFLYGAPPGVRWVPIPSAEWRYIEEVAASPQPILIADATRDPRIDPEIARRTGTAAIAAVRIELDGRLVGVLRYTFTEPPATFDRVHRDFLAKLAASVALGVQNARLVAAERDVSEKLQSALLAIPGRVHGVSRGTLYHSASDTARVGGDFYDLFELPAGRVALVIGDVSGKGLEAAAMTSLAKNVVRAYASEGHDAAGVLDMTNKVLVASSEPETFVTLFLGLLAPSDGSLSYCAGGHPRPLVKRADGGIATLETGSPIVGAFEGARFVEGEARIGAGDVLLLYTDGVTEARCSDGFLGEERLAEFVRSLPPTPASEMPGAVFDFVVECTGGPLSDDLAMLAVSLAP